MIKKIILPVVVFLPALLVFPRVAEAGEGDAAQESTTRNAEKREIAGEILAAVRRSEGPMCVMAGEGMVALRATVHAGDYERTRGETASHHAVVWKEGRAAGKALFRTDASDEALYQALLELGARPGNNLTPDVWDRRHDASHPAPALRTEGTALDVWFLPEEYGAAIPLQEFFEDQGNLGFDFRFSGNADWIPVWRSGCIVCLQSCPGGKIGNAAATVRDRVERRARYPLAKVTGRSPLVDGSPGFIIFRISTRIASPAFPVDFP